MPSHHPSVYINPSLNNNFKVFLAEVLKGLKNEMHLVSEAFYHYGLPGNDIEGVDNLFAVIERTWMGIFNNAMIRTFPDIVTLQEFNVWSSERNVGRCDFLFRLKDELDDLDVIIEAKMYPFCDDWDQTDNVEFYNKILGQAYSYYREEKQYYTRKVWLMALCFEWIQKPRHLPLAKEKMHEWNKEKDPQTDFLTLYYGTNRGVFVYGKIISVHDFENTFINVPLDKNSFD